MHDEESSRRKHSDAKSPGETASTVRVAAFLNSLPRWTLKLRSSFGTFLHSMLMPKAVKFRSTSRGDSLLWPMPLPFPEVFGWKDKTSHDVPDAEWKRLVSMQVGLLSWFALGQPSAAPEDLKIGSRLRAGQWRAVKNLLFLCRDGNTPQFVDASMMGRAAAKFENSEEALGALARAATALHVESHAYFNSKVQKPTSTFERPFRCGLPSGFLKKGLLPTAKPLISERLNFPGPPRFDPCKFFDDATVKRYMHPLDCAQDHLDFEGEVPSVKIFADRYNMIP